MSGSGSEPQGDVVKRVVVGVDGSEPSLRALRWAARDAELTGAVLDVITVWTFPEHAAPLGLVVRVPWPEDVMAQARQALDALIERELPGWDSQRVPVSSLAICRVERLRLPRYEQSGRLRQSWLEYSRSSRYLKASA